MAEETARRELKIPPEFIKRVAANTHAIIQKAILGFGITDCDYQISEPKTLEVATFLLKDLLRLATYQDDEISSTKFAAYWAFWIRKLKPVRVAWKTVDTVRREVTDINERVALAVAFHFLRRRNGTRTDSIRKLCSRGCDGATCWSDYLDRYTRFHNNQFSEYLVYSLGKRTFGPHHLCAVFDSLVFASCLDAGRPETSSLASQSAP
jgi:hypothetical protein